MSERPYSRHYHELVDDPKFAEVYPDDHHYACWSRLLMLADQAWPSSAHLPAGARRASVAKLAEVGLIDLLPGGRFRMHGLQREREQRQEHARKASIARWNAPSIPPSNAGASDVRMPRKDEKRKDEQSIVARAWEEAAGRSLLASGNFAFTYLDDATTRHGESPVVEAIHRARATFPHVPEANALAAAVKRILDPFPDAKKLAAAEREREQAVSSRRGVEATLRANHWMHTEVHPRCPLCQEPAA